VPETHYTDASKAAGARNVSKNFSAICALLLGACASTSTAAVPTINTATAQATSGNLTYASADNVPYGMLGSWFDPSTSGQGFDVTFSPGVEHGNSAIVYWYTFDPAGRQKVWFLALGPIAGNVAHLQIAEPTRYQGFSQPPPQGTQNEAVGSIEFTLVDCSHAHIAWHFDRTLTNGLGAGNDGQMDLQRLTPIVSVLGRDLCSTPLSAFGLPDSGGSEALNQCVANYNGLLAQFQSLNSDYGQCIDTIAGDEGTIDDLENQVASLQADVDSAYDDGYDAGRSDGYDTGYDSGYNEGYGEGYSAGYDEGYGDGYGDGGDDGSSVTGAAAIATWGRAKNVAADPRRISRMVLPRAVAARERAQRTIQDIVQQLERLKKRGR
jgi:hypothetical protein